MTEHRTVQEVPIELPPDFAQWLALREPADVAARATDLVEAVRATLTGDRPYVVHDLGAGTGSLGRWLAPCCPARNTGSCTIRTPTCWPGPARTCPPAPPTAPR